MSIHKYGVDIMEGNKEAYKKEYRKISVRTTDGATISGKVNIGIKGMVSELFTKTADPFIKGVKMDRFRQEFNF